MCGLCSVSATVYKSNTCGKMSLWNEFFLSEKFCQNATGSKMPPLWTLGVTDKNVLQRYRQTLMILIVHKNELFALEIKSSEHYFIDVIQNIYVHEPKKSEIWLLTFPFQSESNFYILSLLKDGSKCAAKISPDTNDLNCTQKWIICSWNQKPRTLF